MDFDSPAAAQKAVSSLKATGVQAQMAKVRELLEQISIPPSCYKSIFIVIFQIAVPLNEISCQRYTVKLRICKFFWLIQASLTSLLLVSISFELSACAPFFSSVFKCYV